MEAGKKKQQGAPALVAVEEVVTWTERVHRGG